jgi:hypothetical protein
MQLVIQPERFTNGGRGAAKEPLPQLKTQYHDWLGLAAGQNVGGLNRAPGCGRNTEKIKRVP